MHAYVVLSLLTGARTEEMRGLRWDRVVAHSEQRQSWIPVSEAGAGGGDRCKGVRGRPEHLVPCHRDAGAAFKRARGLACSVVHRACHLDRGPCR